MENDTEGARGRCCRRSIFNARARPRCRSESFLERPRKCSQHNCALPDGASCLSDAPATSNYVAVSLFEAVRVRCWEAQRPVCAGLRFLRVVGGGLWFGVGSGAPGAYLCGPRFTAGRHADARPPPASADRARGGGGSRASGWWGNLSRRQPSCRSLGRYAGAVIRLH